MYFIVFLVQSLYHLAIRLATPTLRFVGLVEKNRDFDIRNDVVPDT